MSKDQFPYLHGFSSVEQQRLRDQARFSEHIVYQDINFEHRKNILEVGCGVGAQTEILLRRFPDIKLTSVDLNEKQLNAAKESFKNNSDKDRVNFSIMNAQDLDFRPQSFDGAFLCWVLEHVPSPIKVLSEIKRVLRPGSVLYITEVMNSSFFLDPYSPNVWKYWMEFNDFQYENAGDPFIGAKLGNLLQQAGFNNIETNIKTWHLDNRSPLKREETIKYWQELLLSGADTLLESNRVTQEEIDNVAKEFKAVAKDPNAVFYYSFMQAKAVL